MKLIQKHAQKARHRRSPLSMSIELLAPCNLKCPHCYVSHNKKNHLTFQVLDDLLEQFSNGGGFEVTLTGGEIGLRKDLFRIIQSARDRFLSVRLLSSGTRWGPSEWDRIAELGVNKVRMSLYAMDPDVHDAVTLVKGSHERTLATAYGLMERGVEAAFSCPIMTTNAHEVPRVLDFANELGVELAIDPHITQTDAGDERPKELAADVEELTALFRDPKVRAHFSTDNPCETPADELRTCSVGRSSAFIDCKGDLYPCTTWHRPAGNILNQRLLDIWRNSPELNFARSITLGDQEGCRGCGDAGVCNQCVAMNLQERGDVAKPSQTVCDASAAKSIALYGESKQLRRKPIAQARASLPIVA